MTNEVAGAIERPADSAIVVAPFDGGTRIMIAPPRLPWPVYLSGAISLLALLAVIVAGAMVFLFRMPFPGYAAVVGGRYESEPLASRLAGLLGWLLIVPALLAITSAVLRPLTRREIVTIPARDWDAGVGAETAVVFETTEISRRHVARLAVSDILRFELHRDPQGLVESEIVVETRSALAQGRRAKRLTVAGSSSEAEREWLASALNVLLARARGS